jgi:hypothetical protein
MANKISAGAGDELPAGDFPLHLQGGVSGLNFGEVA